MQMRDLLMSEVLLAHGAGGTIMIELIKNVIINNITKRSVLNGLGLEELDLSLIHI